MVKFFPQVKGVTSDEVKEKIIHRLDGLDSVLTTISSNNKNENLLAHECVRDCREEINDVLQGQIKSLTL